MNLNHPSIEDFSDLLRKNDDSCNRKLVVKHNGEVEIVCPDGLMPSVFETDYKFYYEIWIAGNSYSGIEASKDTKHVEKYYNSLIKCWATDKKSFVEFLE